jgi:ribosomal protein S18 acetylase RimI-like enzyme
MIIFSIRKAHAQDLDLTYKIKKNALKEYLEMLWGWNEKAQKDFHENQFNKDHYQIIEQEDEAIGYLEIESYEDHIFLANLMILPRFQGQGIGKIIMGDLLKNNSNIQLEVLKVNQRAIQFYKGFGFTIVDDLEVSFRMKIGF